MELGIVIACALPFELQVTYLYGLFGQRERALALLRHERFYFVVERHPRTLPRHRHQQRVPALRAERSCYWRPRVCQHVMPLERCPHPHVAVTSDSEHTEQSNAERSDSPYPPFARKISCIVLSAPFLFHGTPPVAASARCCRALLTLFWSARSISCRISSPVSVWPCDTAKWRFTTIVPSSKTSSR